MRTVRPRSFIGLPRSVFCVVTLLIPVLAFPQGHVIVTPSQLVWKPLIPGVEIAVISGDPDKRGGLYVIRIRSKDEVKVPPHWHQTDEHVTVLEGSFLMAHGDKYDASKLIQLKPGAHSLMPACTRPGIGRTLEGLYLMGRAILSSIGAQRTSSTRS